VGGPLELDDLPGQFVDPPGHRGVAVEKLVLDLVDVVLQAGDHRGVLVHHLVQDRVEHRLRAQAQQLRAVLQPAADLSEVGGFGLPDTDHEARADEDMQLPELDLLDVVEVPGRQHHHEQGVTVAFHLRPLMRRDGVLHREVV